MSSQLAIVRAAHLIDYINVLRDFGAPVERDLARSRLPPSIEETPDLYVSVSSVIEWIAGCGHDVEPMELGLLAAQNASMASLKPSHRTAIIGAQTGLARLEALLSLARLEDSGIRVGLRAEARHIRVFCDMEHLKQHRFVCFAEWLNLQGIVSVVRSVAGPAWCPQEMCFVSPFAPSEAVCTAFPNTRIRYGQQETSILIDRIDLARSTGGGAPLPHDCARLLLSENMSEANAEELTFADVLRRIIQPYLNGGHPDVALTAEMVGMSKRTLQRRLHQNGLSFSRVLEEARFDLARTLLEDPDARIIDVAMTSVMITPSTSPVRFAASQASHRRFIGAT